MFLFYRFDEIIIRVRAHVLITIKKNVRAAVFPSHLQRNSNHGFPYLFNFFPFVNLVRFRSFETAP